MLRYRTVDHVSDAKKLWWIFGGFFSIAGPYATKERADAVMRRIIDGMTLEQAEEVKP